MRNFRRLRVWQRSHELTLAVYKATAKFPRDEIYGLTSQLRRASSSIPAALAEGYGRTGDTEFVRFCKIASGSPHEVDCHLFLTCDLNLLKPEEHRKLASHIDEVKRMLAVLVIRLTPENC